MPLYVIQRDCGLYVARVGSASSYTPWLQKARTWLTRAAAEEVRCRGNERVLSLEEAMEDAEP